MDSSKLVNGFSKKTKAEKMEWLQQTYFQNQPASVEILKHYWNSDPQLQAKHEEFIENTLTNFYMPLGIAPNFKINDQILAIPMVIEESSVVAAASKAAKFWASRGGFKTRILNNLKEGQVHFSYTGDPKKLQAFFKRNHSSFLESLVPLATRMEKRGGGIHALVLKDKTHLIPNYYQLHLQFKTADAMGANFINSCLEHLANEFEEQITNAPEFDSLETPIKIFMSILSNYVPECLVEARVECAVKDLGTYGDLDAAAFAQKFVEAIEIATEEPYRAVTHNKGIMNGIDSVVLATGNDFRAVEAGVHAFAARDGKYRSLSEASIENDTFHFRLQVPLALGTVGGLTKLHPLVRWCLELLGNPGAEQLMQIVAAAGLAQNFAAVQSLVTTGIQQGHMKMHLLNLLNQKEATAPQKEAALKYFKTHVVSAASVEEFLKSE